MNPVVSRPCESGATERGALEPCLMTRTAGMAAAALRRYRLDSCRAGYEIPAIGKVRHAVPSRGRQPWQAGAVKAASSMRLVAPVVEGLVHGTICESRTVPPAEIRVRPVWRGHSALHEFAGALVAGRARAPTALLTALVVAGTLFSSSGSVVAESVLERQAQCELSAIRDTRSALAIQFIRSACNWLALNGDSLLNESSKGYHVCLVQQLSGVQADQAAGAIVSACRRLTPY